MVTDLKNLNLSGVDLNIVKVPYANQIIVSNNNVFIVGKYLNTEQVETASDYIQSHWFEFI